MSYNSPRLFYGYSTGKAPHSLPLDPSLKVLRRHYGGEPVPVDGPDIPDPPVDPVEPEEHTIKVSRLPVTINVVSDGTAPPPIEF